MEEGGRRQPVMLQNLPIGAKVKIRGDVTAEVTGNPKDGSWIFVRFISHPGDPSQEGTEGLAFADEVLDELK
jgi:hypothetical protein